MKKHDEIIVDLCEAVKYEVELRVRSVLEASSVPNPDLEYHACVLGLTNNERGYIVSALRFFVESTSKMPEEGKEELMWLASRIDSAGCGELPVEEN
jgi:hypothetical protein